MTRHFYISAGDVNVPGTCGFQLHLFLVSENYEEDAPTWHILQNSGETITIGGEIAHLLL